MITLNVNKELVRYSNWSDLAELPGFIQNLNPQEKELKEIIGRYYENEEVNCGLSICRTPHKRGYIVCTTDGYITNIGNHCGKKYFGVDFETMSKMLDHDLDMKEYREKLNYFDRNERNDLNLWIEDKIDISKDILRFLKLINGENQLLVPDIISNKIRNMVKTKTTILTKERKLTEQERDLERIKFGTKSKLPQHKEEKVASILGMSIMNSVEGLRELLILELKNKIEIFPNGQIDNLTDKELKYWNNWHQSIPVTKGKVEQLIHEGMIFFDYDNLKPFEEILHDENHKKMWEKFLMPLKRLKN